MPPLLGFGTKQTNTKHKLKSRNQIIIKHACERGLRYISVAGGGGRGQEARLLIEMLPMIKCHKKDYCFFSLSFFQHLRVQQYTRTAVINYNIDRRPGLTRFNFCQPIYNGPPTIILIQGARAPGI